MAQNISGTNPTVVVCGSIHQDTMVSIDTFPEPGQTMIVNEGVKALGGKGANQAVAAALAEAQTKILGTVGEDIAADEVLAELTAKGVDVHAVQTTWDRPTGTAFIASEREGAPRIFVQRGANMETDPTDFADDIAKANVLLSQGELMPEAIETLASLASLSGTRFVLNLSPVTVATPTLIDNADPLVVNTRCLWEVLLELDLTTGIRRGDLSTQIDALLQYAPSIVVTLSDKGCVYSEAEVDGGDGKLWYQPAVTVPADEIIDRTGSGDAFSGTLAAGLARGSSLKEAVELAVCAGSQAVRSLGATSSYVELPVLKRMVAENVLPERIEYVDSSTVADFVDTLSEKQEAGERRKRAATSSFAAIQVENLDGDSGN